MEGLNLGKTIIKNRLASMVPIYVFMSGLAFCVFIRLMNIYFMVVAEGDGLYYVLSNRYGPLSYVETTTLIFFGFCLMALLLIPARNKIFAVALFVSCLSIACNTLIFRASARLIYVDALRSAEHNMDSIANGDGFYFLEGLGPGYEVRENYLPRLKQYYAHIAESWREIGDPTFQPRESAYWFEDEKAAFTGKGCTCWRALEEVPAASPATLFFSADGKAVGVRADGTRLFGFANPEAATTNDFHSGYFVYTFANDSFPFVYEAVKTNGMLETKDWIYVDETLRYKPHEIRPKRLEAELQRMGTSS